jgi:uncharacterized protein YdhG (YjbR/CyaY superfamily)
VFISRFEGSTEYAVGILLEAAVKNLLNPKKKKEQTNKIQQRTFTTGVILKKIDTNLPGEPSKLLGSTVHRKIIMSKKASNKNLQAAPQNIDDYILNANEEVRPILQKIRETIHHAAPNAAETISYKMPTFKHHRVIAHFAAWQGHIGFYPPVKKDDPVYQDVSKYANDKGNLLFPLDQPIPYNLIEKITRERFIQDSAARKTKMKASPTRKSLVKKPPVKKNTNSKPIPKSKRKARGIV